MGSPWESFPSTLAERVLCLLPTSDLQTVRLVNKDWHHATNYFVKHQHPETLTELFRLHDEFPNLTVVDISSVDIRNERQLFLAAVALSKLTGLEEVVIRAAPQLTFKNLAEQLPQLQRLVIRPGGIHSIFHGCISLQASPIPLTNLHLDLFQNLQHLDVSWNEICLDVIKQIAALPNLLSLNLKNCLGVNDALLDLLSYKGKVKSLNLSNTQVTDEGLMTMNDLPLQCLNLSRCEGITDDGMFWIQYVRSIEELDISGCPNLTSAGMEQLSNLPRLHRLYLQEVKLVGSSCFKEMVELEVLNLRDCSWVDDQTLGDLSLCQKLKSLNIRNCIQVTDAGLRKLQNFSELQSINLRGCTQITDGGVGNLSALTHLKDLDLSFLDQITDQSLYSLMGTSQLSRLVLNWCNKITSEGLQKVKENCQALEELSIKGCHNMQSEDLIWIANSSSIRKLDYEHSLCSVSQPDKHQQDYNFPILKPIDSVGCFISIC